MLVPSIPGAELHSITNNRFLFTLYPISTPTKSDLVTLRALRASSLMPSGISTFSRQKTYPFAVFLILESLVTPLRFRFSRIATTWSLKIWTRYSYFLGMYSVKTGAETVSACSKDSKTAIPRPSLAVMRVRANTVSPSWSHCFATSLLTVKGIDCTWFSSNHLYW